MSMNIVILKGRLVRDPEMRTTQSCIANTRFTIAVDRPRSANGERQTDFINCVAWRNTAEFISKWFVKGQEICVEGSLNIRNYDAQDGSKRTVAEVSVSNADFCGKREDNAQTVSAPAPAPKQTEFEEISDDELPF